VLFQDFFIDLLGLGVLTLLQEIVAGVDLGGQGRIIPAAARLSPSNNKRMFLTVLGIYASIGE
jgi:hypothetical protein